MAEENMHLVVMSPEKTLFDGKVSYVRLPGSKGEFTVFINHAPLISSLDAGMIEFESEKTKTQIAVTSGFVEVNNNKISTCVTEAPKQTTDTTK